MKNLDCLIPVKLIFLLVSVCQLFCLFTEWPLPEPFQTCSLGDPQSQPLPSPYRDDPLAMGPQTCWNLFTWSLDMFKLVHLDLIIQGLLSAPNLLENGRLAFEWTAFLLFNRRQLARKLWRYVNYIVIFDKKSKVTIYVAHLQTISF